MVLIMCLFTVAGGNELINIQQVSHIVTKSYQNSDWTKVLIQSNVLDDYLHTHGDSVEHFGLGRRWSSCSSKKKVSIKTGCLSIGLLIWSSASVPIFCSYHKSRRWRSTPFSSQAFTWVGLSGLNPFSSQSTHQLIQLAKAWQLQQGSKVAGTEDQADSSSLKGDVQALYTMVTHSENINEQRAMWGVNIYLGSRFLLSFRKFRIFTHSVLSRPVGLRI